MPTPAVFARLIGLPSTLIAAALGAIGLMIWIEPYTTEGRMAVLLVGFCLITLLVRLVIRALGGGAAPDRGARQRTATPNI